MNDLIVQNNEFMFSARDILKRAGVNSKNIARTLKRNIEENGMLEIGVDFIKVENDIMLSKRGMEFVLISLRTAAADVLRKQLIEKMNQQEAALNPRATVNAGLKLAYALIESEKERVRKEKEAELLVLTAKGKRLREEVITKINELARKIGMEQNNGNVRAVYARLYRCFTNTNKRWYWGNAMQAKNHLEYIGEMGGISDLKLLHEILISFIDESSSFYAEDHIDSKGENRNGN